MIFLHIIADYNLQGWLADAKQKQWWKNNYPDSSYKYDYLVALFMHSFCWSFMIMIPLFFINKMSLSLLIFFILNIVLHMIIDTLKANYYKINLMQDQLLHLLQIISTALFLIN